LQCLDAAPLLLAAGAGMAIVIRKAARADISTQSEAAAWLAQNHHVTFAIPASEEFFRLYGPGKAENFPGFYYTDDGKLTTRFLPPYTAWLAMFGVVGLAFANALLFYITVMPCTCCSE